MYKCSKCGLGVIVHDGKGGILPQPIRACKCNAPINVDMNSNVQGGSTVGVGTPLRQPKVTLG